MKPARQEMSVPPREKEIGMSLLLILGSFLLALVFGVVFGRGFVPWLIKHGFVQPLKKEVEEIVYSGKTDDAAQ